MTWVPLAVVSVQLVILVFTLIGSWRLYRRLQHARELDTLLAYLCVQCFARQHQPIWVAWTAVMGSISVEVKQTRDLPGDDG